MIHNIPRGTIVYHIKQYRETMEIERVLGMTGGEGETSYALNSQFQRRVIDETKSFLQDTIIDLYCKTSPKCLRVTDFGCSSGPNSLIVIEEIIDAIDFACLKMGHVSPELQVFLNDLPGNDFNNVFRYFQHNLKKDKVDRCMPCFIAGVPGSFYERLFPAKTLNFVHSSYSLHFLSQVPPGIECNKSNIYIAKTSPTSVVEAYSMQFQTDFKKFLSLRSKEVINEGRMVITIQGRRCRDPLSGECCDIFELLAESFRDMISQGLIEEAKLNTFNMPFYAACEEEIRSIIEEEGSFHADLLYLFDTDWDAYDKLQNKNIVFDKDIIGKNIARCIRVVTESMIICHFGEEIIEDLFHKFAYHVGEYLVKEKGYHVSMVICMTRK